MAVAAAVRVEGGTIAEARVGLTNMGSVPVRARGGGAGPGGAAGDGRRDQGRGPRRGRGHTPPNDANGDEDYRRHLAGVLTGRAVLAAAGAS